ncbi:efflux RND transporter periplasmic adaptor subunit [uncultured Tateyamaria sp.]|uniref:efflux RND transporter periplasmic adaptor subunit n=1 Tax=uncultured Tateyamaria sp. TaxID=455651 RepID=UPI0026242C36|nr:efflux RND transporter periplasmic adaptor subunit [uncultured Tateyamaria sp.]
MTWRILLFVPAIAVGIGAFIWINGSGPEPATGNGARPLVPVRVTQVVLEPVTVSVTGYGRVEPVRTWQGISRVDGQIIATTNALAVGGFVQAGEVIIEVDPRDYEIARDRALANLAIAETELAELNAQEENTAEQLALEQQIEAVIQADVDRRASLVESGSTAIASLEQAQRDLIAQQRQVLDLENALALYPVQRQSAEATLASRQVDVEEAERNLANTKIVAPFEGRVLEETVSEGVYIRPGDQLLTIAGIDVVEIVAEVQPAAMSDALSLLIPDATDVINRFNPFETDAAIKALGAAGISATVVLSQGNEYRYPARLARLDGSVDNTTGTVGIVVEVQDAGRPDPATRRPPLTNGAFVAVLFHGLTDEAQAVVPRSALIEEEGSAYVYVVDPDSRLQRRAVTIAGRSAGDMVISSGLASGDTLVLTPPEPAIIGTFLAPVPDENAREAQDVLQ